MHSNPVLWLGGIALVALVVGCGGGSGGGSDGPDLVPALAPGSVFYFEYVSGDVCVYVRNAGNQDAGASMVQITYNCPTAPQSVSAAVPALAAGATSPQICLPIPCVGCFDPDCDFTITVDSAGAVSETNESNNSVGQLILG